MSKFKVEVEGLDEVRRKLRQLKDDAATQMLRDANKRIAEEMVDEAKSSVPVRTGRLLASLRALGPVSGARGKAGGARVPYAAAVHWGTGARSGLRGPHNIARHDFYIIALGRMDQKAIDDYENALKDLIRRYNLD